jgi:hypothetical protein
MRLFKRFADAISLCVATVLIGSLFALGASTIPVNAQSYSFSVPELKMQAYVQVDGSVRIVYDITFENLGSPIDIVDIGLPHRDYNIGNMSASIDGVALSDIRTSEYIDIGVEIHLGNQAIPAGSRGTLHFEATMPDMVYQDTTNRDHASLRITPTWFDSNSVQGTGTIAVAIHLPPGIEPDEVLYQQEPFTAKALFEDQTVVVWEWTDRRATEAHIVGVSFPQRGMTNVIRMTFLDLVKAWLEDNPGTVFLLGAVAMTLAAILFFRFSGGTGCTVFAILGGGLLLLFINSPITILLAIPVLLAMVIVNETKLRKKKPNTYLPPIAQVEGGGIKRGLTAPEAAVLLELPLNKILTLTVFGLLEKGLVELVKDDPLAVTVSSPFKTWDNAEFRRSSKLRHKHRSDAARAAGTVIHGYEDDFLDQLERNPKKSVADIDFTKAVERLITSSATKMKGFDLSDTKEYYARVITRAMAQAQTIGEVEEREKYLDKYLPWVMMDESYPTVLTTGGYQYWPMWARPAVGRPIMSGSGPSQSAPRSGSGRSLPGRTSAGDVAGSFAGWAENTMGGLAGAILPSSMNLPSAKGGFVNLSGVDKVTGDVFQALSKASSSGKSGGGGGGGCACACAGCACACACAGGGR